MRMSSVLVELEDGNDNEEDSCLVLPSGTVNDDEVVMSHFS